jgi:hypothetical protein
MDESRKAREATQGRIQVSLDESDQIELWLSHRKEMVKPAVLLRPSGAPSAALANRFDALALSTMADEF